MDEDPALLRQMVAGDAQALRTLLERHGPRVWAEIDADIGGQWRSMLDADDVMQVTYLEAFLRADRLEARDTNGFIGWLRRIAQNNLRDAIKELDRKKRPPPRMRVHAPAGEDSYVTLVEMLGTESATPSRHVAQREAAEAIEAMLNRLPEDYGKVVRMYDLQGREIGEVAAAMGRSPGAVHMLRVRAHDRLRDLLGAETNFFTHTA
jgi:RNA polymerase sigma-70 factor (ECF subfamily)